MKRTTIVTTNPQRRSIVTVPKTPRKKRRSASDFFSRALTSFNRIFTRPFAFILLALSILLAISEIKATATNKSILETLLTKLPTGGFRTYLLAHRAPTIAFLAYTSVTTAALPFSQLFPGILISALIAFLVPEKTSFEYLIQTILLFFFVALKRPIDRIIIISAGVLAWTAGWLSIS